MFSDRTARRAIRPADTETGIAISCAQTRRLRPSDGMDKGFDLLGSGYFLAGKIKKEKRKDTEEIELVAECEIAPPAFGNPARSNLLSTPVGFAALAHARCAFIASGNLSNSAACRVGPESKVLRLGQLVSSIVYHRYLPSVKMGRTD